MIKFLIYDIFLIVITFFVMKKEKQKVPKDQIDESPLSGGILWYTLLLNFLLPFFAQTIFYYGWRKQLPKKAKRANLLGWLTILLWIIILIFFIHIMFNYVNVPYA